MGELNKFELSLDGIRFINKTENLTLERKTTNAYLLR